MRLTELEKENKKAAMFSYCAICYHALDKCSHCDIKALQSRCAQLEAALQLIEECLCQLHVPLDTRVTYAHRAATEAITRRENP